MRLVFVTEVRIRNEDNYGENADYLMTVRPNGHAILNRYSDKCFRKRGYDITLTGIAINKNKARNID